MKLTIMAYGTRGDVQPFVAVALALKERGHDVTLAAPSNFDGWVQQFGLRYAPLHGNAQEILESEEGRRWLSAGNVLAFFQALARIGHEIRHELRRDMLAACEGADAIVSTIMTVPHGLTLSEKLGVPLVHVFTMPMGPPSSLVPQFMVATRALPLGVLNWITHWLFETLDWRTSKADTNEWRAALGLAPLTQSHHAEHRRRRTQQVHIYSAHVAPKPADWGDDVTVAGAIMLPAAARASLDESKLPPDLEAWLADGAPPVFLSFGSMPVLDPDSVLSLVRDVARDLGVRALVGAGWSRVPKGLSDGVFVVGSVNHDWLFPRCAAVVHHGGAGTTATSLRAGAPTVICSVFADQPFWGERVRALGVGATLPFQKLTRDSLKAALQSALHPSVKERAQALADKIQREDGLSNTVAAIERALTSARHPDAETRHP